MKPSSALYQAVIRQSHRVVTHVDAWYDGSLVYTGVPVDSGTLRLDDTGALKRAVSLTVPAEVPGYRLDPGNDPTHPLACYGQRLHVTTGIALPGGGAEMFSCGWFLVTRWERSEAGGTIAVDGADLAKLIQDDRLLGPYSPGPGQTFKGAFTALLAGTGLSCVFDQTLTDRSIAPSLLFERERDQALTDIAAGWPARWLVGDDGLVHVLPPYAAVTPSSAPVVTLTDGAAGVVCERARSGERGRQYNGVVATGAAAATTGVTPSAIAKETDPASPIRWGGPYGRVPRFYSSDMLTTPAQCQAVADAQLVTYSGAGHAETVECIPDPSLELGDVARVFTADGDAYTGRITAIDLPLTVDGAAKVTVSTAPGSDASRTARKREGS